MRQLYTIELIALVKELQSLAGFYLDKFYESEENTFRFSLSRKGEKTDVRCVLPYSIGKTEYIEQAEEPTNFATAVRKRISGFVIDAIEQYNNDRIILIKFRKGEETISVILEMFGQGNLIVADEDMKALLVYKPHTFKDRTVQTNSKYTPPSSSNINILDAKAVEERIKKIGEEKSESILESISKNVGIGKLYTEDALLKLGVDPKSKVSTLKERLPEIARSINQEIKDCVESKTVNIYKKDGKMIDFSLCEISKYAESERTKCGSLQEALDLAYQNSSQHVTLKNEEVEGLKVSIGRQKAMLDEIDQQIADNKKIGDTILNNMQQINELIKEAKENRHITKEQLQKLSKSIKILDINLKDKTMTVEL